MPDKRVLPHMNPIARRIIILGTPLALGILDLFHPIFSTGIYQAISPRLDWWITLHILQLPLFFLLALSVYLLLDGVQGTLATFSKVGLAIFVVFYPALDAILGIGTGALVSYTNGLAGLTQVITAVAIESFFSNNVTILVGTLGEVGWAMAILLAVLALSRPTGPRWLVIITVALVALAISYYQVARNHLIPELLPGDNLFRLMLLLAIALGLLVQPRIAAGLLVVATFLLSVDHAPPFGPVAMACYFVAALQLEFFPEKAPLAEQEAAPAKQNTVPTEQEVISSEQDVIFAVDVH
jgi:hypothetical protein